VFYDLLLVVVMKALASSLPGLIATAGPAPGNISKL
jgi:hypothetical protein